MRTSIAVIAGLALASVQCTREHLSPAFGRANHDAYAMQRDRPVRAAPPATMALDTQEASVISKSYLRSLAPEKGSETEPSPVIVLTPQRPGQAPQQLAPSVPKQ